MKDCLQEYSNAFEAHLKAQQDEMTSKKAVRLTYYRLQSARDELKAVEKELLEDLELKHE